MLYFFVGLCFLFVMGIIWKLPKCQVTEVRKAGNISQDDVWKAENEYRKTLVQIVGGIVVLTGIFFSWQEFQESRFEFRQSQNNIKSGQIASRYSRAVELLSKSESNSRIGAIYALEQIAIESPENYLKTVVNVLVSFLKSRDLENFYFKGEEKEYSEIIEIFLKIDKMNLNAHEKVSEKMDIYTQIELVPEIQTALGVICKLRLEALKRQKPNLYEKIINIRKKFWDKMLNKKRKGELRAELDELEKNLLFHFAPCRIDFSRIKLIGIKIDGADLCFADLVEADLRGADLENADLRKANLERVNLKMSNLHRADLSGACLQGALLQDASLFETEIGGADFRGAKLHRVDFRKSYPFDAKFQGAILSEATFREAELQGAQFETAVLFKTNFQKAKLYGAMFHDAYLHNGIFKEAYLENAEFNQADLRNADFTGARGLTFQMLAEAKSLKGIKGLDPALEKRLKLEKPGLFK